MNLTSKRMLQLIAGCAGAVALTATAQTTYVADNFEYVGEGYGTTNGAADMLISAYKSQPYGTSGEFTNYQWFVESSDDVSKLVASDSPYAGSVRPIAGSATQYALNLETNGKTLVRTNNSPLAFGSSPVYVDTLIKFTPSEDNPTITDASVKAAVFLDANLHLWVYHGGTYVATDNTSSDTGLVVSTNDWHRLTIMMSKMPGSDNDYAFKVFIDQQVVSCAAGMQDDYSPNGPWFYSASIEGSFAAVAFQGTGMVDELVVADEVDLGTGAALLLTLAFDPAQVLVTTGGVAVAQYEQVPTATAVSIYALPWFQITSGGALLSGATSNLFSSAVTSIVGTVTATVVGQTNEITSAAFDSTTGLPVGFADAPIADISAWATANGVNPEGVTSEMLDDYLLNVAPATDAELEITSITYGASVVTITIAATNPSVDLTDINGVLNVWTTDNLATTAFAPIGTFVVTVPAAAQLTVTVPNGDGNFIKASVDTTNLAE